MTTLSGCWWSFGGPSPLPSCQPENAVPSLVASRTKAKPGETIALEATASAGNACPAIRSVRFFSGEQKIAEQAQAPYKLDLTVKPGENGVPAGAPNADVVFLAQVVFETGAVSRTSAPVFVRIDFAP